MAINIIFGPGGSGKSLFQMLVVVQELRESRRNIVTNLSIDAPAFNAFLEKEYPSESLDLVGRLRLLTVEETKEFWKYRGPIVWTGREYDMVEDKGVNGVCFIIDEAGASGFSAQGWAEKEGRSSRGVEASWYLDQQRKFGDNIYASTNGRAPVGIAKAFRDKAHSFIKLKNGYQTSYGMFKARGRFQWKKYASEPGVNSEPFAQGEFKFGTGLEDCYRTQDGVGITGNKADIGARAKGWSAWWLVPIAFGIAAMVGIVPRLLGLGAGKFMGADGSDGSKPAAVAPVVPSSTREGVTPSPVINSLQEPAMPQEKVTGYSMGKFSVSWAEGWADFGELADTPGRKEKLIKYAALVDAEMRKPVVVGWK